LYLNENLVNLEKPQQLQNIISAKSIIDDAISLIRNISHSLMPPTLKNFGLESATTDLFQKISGSGIINASARFHDYRERLQVEQELLVFRIIQETILNVKQHTNLNYIEINISCNDQYLEIEMVYLQNKEIQFSTVVDINSKSRGLLSLKNRIQMIDGQRTSQIKDGYHFEVIQLPLKLN
jgi:signal transduction histidine kinase